MGKQSSLPFIQGSESLQWWDSSEMFVLYTQAFLKSRISLSLVYSMTSRLGGLGEYSLHRVLNLQVRRWFLFVSLPCFPTALVFICPWQCTLQKPSVPQWDSSHFSSLISILHLRCSFHASWTILLSFAAQPPFFMATVKILFAL